MTLKLPTCLVALSLATALLPGCGNKVSGKIDGEKVGVKDGYFVQYEYQGYGVIYITLTDVADACETVTAYLDEVEDADTAEEAAEIYATYFPEEFWTVSITAITDPGDDLSGDEFDGVSWDEVPAEDGEATLTFSHTLKLLDEDFFSLEGEYDDYYDTYFSDGGTLTIKKHVVDESISGSFEAAVTTDDGDEAGEVKVKFDVLRCDDLEVDF